MNLQENETIRYRAVYSGNVLMESTSKAVIEQFVGTLSKQVQESVQIVPVTETGSQVLLG